jgi:hypothetical protein
MACHETRNRNVQVRQTLKVITFTKWQSVPLPRIEICLSTLHVRFWDIILNRREGMQSRMRILNGALGQNQWRTRGGITARHTNRPVSLYREEHHLQSNSNPSCSAPISVSEFRWSCAYGKCLMFLSDFKWILNPSTEFWEASTDWYYLQHFSELRRANRRTANAAKTTERQFTCADVLLHVRVRNLPCSRLQEHCSGRWGSSRRGHKHRVRMQHSP